MAKRIAVIDIGSNSIRMVVYERTSRYAFHLLHEEKSKVRISENAYKFEGKLQAVPMQRTFDALHDFIKITQSFKTKKLLCVATSALRDAPNAKEFLNKVKEKLGLNIKIISGEKEAYLGGIACATLLPQQTNALSIDIGGGSTEFSSIDGDSVSGTLSLNLGTIRLKELYFDSDDIDGAIKYIDKELQKIPITSYETLIGIGGTFRALSSAIMKEESYQLSKMHAYSYSCSTLTTFTDKILAASTDADLQSLHIKENRYDVIKPGTLILQRLLKKIEFKKIVTSGVGVREGVFLSDLLRNSKHKFPHNYNCCVKYLLDSQLSDTTFSSQLTLLSKKLFDLSAEYFGIDKKYRYELALAAKLYPTGSNTHFYSQNKHAYYLIQNALEYGFTHESNTLIATLCKYANNRLPTKSHLQKYSDLLPEEKTTQTLSYLLSLSILLLSHRPKNIDFVLSFKDNVLKVSSKKSLYLTQYNLKKLEPLELKIKIIFNS
ncbi:Ppx/GppA family phosphatase [Sulfurimonas sp. SAG-AH-194-C21]|nr:Ppx/GppA phosphatase family protein [Sulfurimonas sp. SAG-AH-194-C21]MDF1884199.1 Ppx/GppA family phosphatase [Sulfurimonas sp. SAG-AH-194-C21]